MYRQIQFYHSAIVYCLKTGTMIQLFLYIFKSNACETHPRKAFISNHILYICYICTKKEADKFIHHLLLS